MKWLFIAVIVPAAVLVPLTTGGLRFKQLSGDVRLIWGYLLAGGLINLAAICLAAQQRNNLPLLHLYTAVEFVLLSQFYRLVLTGRMVRLGMLVGCILFPLVCLLNALFVQEAYTFNSYTRSVEAILLIAYALICLNRLVEQAGAIRLQALPLFWIDLGLLFYFSGSLLLFLFHVFLMASNWASIWAWRLHGCLVLIMYTCFTIAFIRCRR